MNFKYPSRYRADSGLSPVRTCARRAHHKRDALPLLLRGRLSFSVWSASFYRHFDLLGHSADGVDVDGAFALADGCYNPLR